jgi:hypothetical protein
MLDLVFLAVAVGFFALSWRLVRFFRKLEEGSR